MNRLLAQRILAVGFVVACLTGWGCHQDVAAAPKGDDAKAQTQMRTAGPDGKPWKKAP